MTITFDVNYHEKYTPKGGRIERVREVVGETTVTITEFENGDLPVAFKVKSYFIDGWAQNEILSLNERLYTKMNMDLQELKGEFEREGNIVLDWDNITETRADKFKTIRDYESRCAEMRKKASQYLLISGEVFEEIGEPMYVIHTFGLGNNHGGMSLSVAFHYNENIGKNRYFNALERDKAIAYAVDLATKRGDTKSIDELKSPKVNIIPMSDEYVKRNPQKDHGEGSPVINAMEGIVEHAQSSQAAAAVITGMAVAEVFNNK